jgi:hypothetical protein
MPNSKLRCKSCKEFFPRGDFIAPGFHSEECRVAWRCRQAVKRPAQPRKAKRQGNEFSAEFDRVRPLVHARSRGRCEARIPGVCTGKATHVHHRKLRGLGGGGGSNELSNLIDLCLTCHAFVHENPAWAKRVGLIVSGWDDPALLHYDLSAVRPILNHEAHAAS